MTGSNDRDIQPSTSVLTRGLRVLGEAKVVLDVGCGAGRSSGALAAGARVIAMDINGDKLARAPRDPNVLYVRGDATRVPIASGTTDGVYSFGLLQVLGDDGNERIRQALRELRRALKASGVAIMGTLADFRSQGTPYRSLTGAEVSQCMRGTFALFELIGLMDGNPEGERARYWYIHALPIEDDNSTRVSERLARAGRA